MKESELWIAGFQVDFIIGRRYKGLNAESIPVGVYVGIWEAMTFFVEKELNTREEEIKEEERMKEGKVRRRKNRKKKED